LLFYKKYYIIIIEKLRRRLLFMEENEIIYCWVRYIDDYNYIHLAPIEKENDLDYIKENYNILNIESVGA
jgi:hypothetical protein